MSFKGEVEAQCPGQCDCFIADVWSFIRGDQHPDLRLALIARELNLLLCPGCSKPFFAPAPYVYYEPQAELLAFVFPDSYSDKEEYWRGKMAEDFAAFKKGLGGKVSDALEPEIFFGVEGLGALLEHEDFRNEECEVMEYYAKDLGLSLYRVSRKFARRNDVPFLLPNAAPPGQKTTRETVIQGLEKIVAANDRLTAYSRYLEVLSGSGQELPPRSISAVKI